MWGGGTGVTAYIEVYKDVRKIWGGFLDSSYKYGYGILTNIINKHLKIVIFRLKIIDLGLNLAKIINMGLKSSVHDYKNGSCFGGFSCIPLPTHL